MPSDIKVLLTLSLVLCFSTFFIGRYMCICVLAYKERGYSKQLGNYELIYSIAHRCTL